MSLFLLKGMGLARAMELMCTQMLGAELLGQRPSQADGASTCADHRNRLKSVLLTGVPRSFQGTGLSYSGKLMAVGRARMDGVEVHGNAQLLGMSGFEAYANSTAHRPAQFTFTSSGQSLQVVLMTHTCPCSF